MSSDAHHIPVMLQEVLGQLSPQDGEVYVDGTFGGGGYTRAFLEAADCTVIAIDQDPDAKARARSFEQEFGDRFIFIHGAFGDVEQHICAAGFEQVDGFVLDLGVSSFQLDEAGRGFSFRFNGPLDMRMNTSEGQTAADLVNTEKEHALADIIYRYGEERMSRRIAKVIVARRSERRFETTEDLADVIRAVVPKSRKDDLDPATRTFQALRIAVNDELGELERALEASKAILKPQGRLVVVSFHSLEDGAVKHFMREHAGLASGTSRYLPDNSDQKPILFDLPQKKPLSSAPEETRANPRARSSRLRIAIRRSS